MLNLLPMYISTSKTALQKRRLRYFVQYFFAKDFIHSGHPTSLIVRYRHNRECVYNAKDRVLRIAVSSCTR